MRSGKRTDSLEMKKSKKKKITNGVETLEGIKIFVKTHKRVKNEAKTPKGVKNRFKSKK